MNKIEPKITPQYTITVQQEAPTTFNGKYELVAVNPDGTDKPGTSFEIGVKGFNKLYKAITAQPEGDAVEMAQFRVKKKPTT
jgi:hypothetical protein